MKKIVIAAAAVAMFAAQAQAADLGFELSNNSDMTIENVYVKYSNQTQWTHDMLGSEYLYSGDTYRFEVSGDRCKLDVKIKFEDGTVQTRRNIDLCNVYAIATNGPLAISF
ncbi:hypothetical protein [Rhizobium leguminosarum]|uniref:hypothetical protein n=1 Tax=Rhizobium leguminosarum TaxID=384 RepID=UPI003F9BEE1F